MLKLLVRAMGVWFVLVTMAVADEPRTLVFGVLNQQSAIKTAERWNPIFKYISDATGYKFQLKMGPKVTDTDEMMGRGEFDLVFTNHNFQKKYDGPYKVIARWGGNPIYGVIAVLNDSPVRELKHLSGKRIAFPSASAFVAYAVPVAALNSQRVTFTPVFAGNQEGALAQLKARNVDAAAVNSRFVTQYAASNGLQYREVFVSEGFAELPVIAHQRLPADIVNNVRSALLAMSKDPKAKALLDAADCPGFEAATDRDYDKVRKVYRLISE